MRFRPTRLQAVMRETLERLERFSVSLRGYGNEETELTRFAMAHTHTHSNKWPSHTHTKRSSDTNSDYLGQGMAR
jgi:hypothetical protein